MHIQIIDWISFGVGKLAIIKFWPSRQTNFHSYVERVLEDTFHIRVEVRLVGGTVKQRNLVITDLLKPNETSRRI